MAIARSYATLRISSKQHSVAELTEALGTPPTTANQRGDIIDRTNPGAGRFRATRWSLQAPVHEHRTTAEHLGWLAAFAESHQPALAEIRRTASVDLFCFCEQLGDEGGWTVPADILARIGQQGLGITFNVYSVGDAEI